MVNFYDSAGIIDKFNVRKLKRLIKKKLGKILDIEILLGYG